MISKDFNPWKHFDNYHEQMFDKSSDLLPGFGFRHHHQAGEDHFPQRDRRCNHCKNGQALLPGSDGRCIPSDENEPFAHPHSGYEAVVDAEDLAE